MTQPRGCSARFGSAVVGTGHYVPQRVRSNDDVARLAGTDDAWITARTGIRERRVAEESENSGTMAYEASWRALADAGVSARDLDLIIVCTVTPEMAVPSTACLLQNRLGVSGQGVPAFDLVAACSGFMYGLATAHAHMQVGSARHILVVGVDTLSRMTDCSDRATAALLADGAGAVVLRRSDDPGRGILFTHVGADGSGHDLLYAPGGLNRSRSPSDELPGSGYYLRMDGPKVFKLAVSRMAQLVEEAAAVLACTTTCSSRTRPTGGSSMPSATACACRRSASTPTSTATATPAPPAFPSPTTRRASRAGYGRAAGWSWSPSAPASPGVAPSSARARPERSPVPKDDRRDAGPTIPLQRLQSEVPP